MIPDEILLDQLYRFLANPAAGGRIRRPQCLPRGKIALLVEGGSGYGAAVGNTYGTSGQSVQSKGIISIPFPSQIAQVRASESTGGDAGSGAAKHRVTDSARSPVRQADRPAAHALSADDRRHGQPDPLQYPGHDCQ